MLLGLDELKKCPQQTPGVTCETSHHSAARLMKYSVTESGAKAAAPVGAPVVAFKRGSKDSVLDFTKGEVRRSKVFLMQQGFGLGFVTFSQLP